MWEARGEGLSADPLGFDRRWETPTKRQRETPTELQPRAPSGGSTAERPDCENFHRLPRNIIQKKKKTVRIYRGQSGPQPGLPSVFHLIPRSENLDPSLSSRLAPRCATIGPAPFTRWSRGAGGRLHPLLPSAVQARLQRHLLLSPPGAALQGWPRGPLGGRCAGR